MYNVGYNDTKAFRTTFKKITGLSPVGYRNKYNRAMLAQPIDDYSRQILFLENA